MATKFAQTSLAGHSDAHQAVNKGKRQLEALRQKFIDTGKADKNLAIYLTDHARSVDGDLRNIQDFQKKLAAMAEHKMKMEQDVLAKEKALSAALAKNPLPALANRIPSDIGRRLLTLTAVNAAYLQTDAYIDMAVDHSQPGHKITAPAAAELSRRLEAAQIDHEESLSDRDQTIRRLQAQVDAAEEKVAANADHIRRCEASVKEQLLIAEELRKFKREAIATLQKATAKVTKQKEEILALAKVADKDSRQRKALSLKNLELTETNEQLQQEIDRLQTECETSRDSAINVRSRLAYALQISALEKDRALGDIE
jgi:hypothetical protein